MVDQGRGKTWVKLAVLCCGLVAGGLRLARPAPAAGFADRKAAGAELFATRGCTHCHGDDGQGTEKGPPLRNLRKKLSGDKVREQIVHGGEGMPAFGASLQSEQVEELVSFLGAKKWVTPPVVVHPVEAVKPEAGSPGS